MIACAACLGLAVTAGGEPTPAVPGPAPGEPWNGARERFAWNERVEPDTTSPYPSLVVKLTIPLGRPGTYHFDAPCIVPKGHHYPCIARGVMPEDRDLMFAGTPVIRFHADTTMIGHATLVFPGWRLMRMKTDGALSFEFSLDRVVQDTVLVPQLDRGQPVRFKVVTRSHKAAEFQARAR